MSAPTIETILVGEIQMYRVRYDDQTRTAPAPATLSLLRGLVDSERARNKQLERDLLDAERAVKMAIGHGANATQHRAAVTAIQTDIAGCRKHTDRLLALADEVRAHAIERIAVPLSVQAQTVIDEVMASLPQVSTQEAT